MSLPFELGQRAIKVQAKIYDHQFKRFACSLARENLFACLRESKLQCGFLKRLLNQQKQSSNKRAILRQI